MTKIYSILLFFSSILGFSQVGGEHVYSFLDFSTSARQTALGGSVLTLTDDVNQPLFNPATINNDLDGKLSLNYVNYLLDVNYVSTTYAHKVNDKLGTFHSGLTYLNYGTFIAADENGNETGSFKAYDMALSLGYAYQIPNSHFRTGLTVKVINSVIETYTSLGVAVDFGVLYDNIEKPYKISAVVRNFGTQLKTYDGTKEPLPLQIQLGGSYQPEHVPIRLYGTLDNLQKWQLAYANPSDETTDFYGNVTRNEPNAFTNAVRHLVIGAELFPDKGFNLRLGYNVQRSHELRLNDLRTFSGLSLGFGLKMKRFKLNYAFSKYHPVADTHSFGLMIDL